MVKLIITLLLVLPMAAFASAPDLCAFADRRLEQVQTDWSHSGFYPMASEVARSAQGRGGKYRENLGRYFKDETTLYTAWRNSPTHNANLVASSTAQCLRSKNGYWVLITWLKTS